MIEVEIIKSTVAKKQLVGVGKKLLLEDSEAMFLVSINKAKIVNKLAQSVEEKFVEKFQEEVIAPNQPLVIKKKRGRPAKV